MDILVLTDVVERQRLKKYIFNPIFDDSHELLLASENTPLLQGNVYITHPSFIPTLLNKVSEKDNNTFFVSGPCPEAETIAIQKRVNLILVDMDLTELHNRLYTRLHAIRQFRHQCMNDIWKSRVPFELISSGARYLHTPLFLLSQRLELIYHDGNQTMNDDVYTSLVANASLDTGLLPGFDAAELESRPCVLRTRSGNIFWIKKISGSTSLFYLAALLNSDRAEESYASILNIVGDYIITQNEHVAHGTADPTHALARLLDSMEENRNLSPEELRIRLKGLEYPVGRFFTTVIVFPESKQTLFPLLAIVNHLRRFFPNQNISVHNGIIVVLFCRNEIFLRDAIDETAFNALLRELNCFAVVNNTISNWAKLLTNYKLSLAIMHIALTMNKGNRQENKRIFFFEDYSTFFIINLCQQAFSQMGLDDDTLIYLGMQALTTLAIYDSIHDDDLVSVLYQYLLHDKNAVQTGQALYMHRNTVRKKLNTIKEIMCIDIDDPSLHFRLLFSCILLQYYRDYLGKSFRATIGNMSDMDSLWPTFPIKL